MTTEVILTATVQTPEPPDSLRLGDGSSSMPLGAFPDADLRRVCQAFTEDLLARAAEQRMQARESEAADV